MSTQENIFVKVSGLQEWSWGRGSKIEDTHTHTHTHTQTDRQTDAHAHTHTYTHTHTHTDFSTLTYVRKKLADQSLCCHLSLVYFVLLEWLVINLRFSLRVRHLCTVDSVSTQFPLLPQSFHSSRVPFFPCFILSKCSFCLTFPHLPFFLLSFFSSID